MPKDHGRLAIILSKMKPDKDDKDEDAGPSEGEMSAAEEAMAALQADDAEGFARAMKAFVQICGEEY